MSRLHAKFVFLISFICATFARPLLGQPIDTCGTLVQGMNQCVLFELGDGTRYLLDSEGGFPVGSFVHVVGQIQPTCFSICTQANGCVVIQSVTLCQAVILPAPTLPGDRCGLCGVGASTLGAIGLTCWLCRMGWSARRRRHCRTNVMRERSFKTPGKRNA